MSRKLLPFVVALATATLLAVPTAAIAGPGGGGGGGAPGDEETAGNNLSQPTYFVGGTVGAPSLRIACPSDAVAPDPATDPTSTYSGAEYYVQKTAADWTAACSSPAAVAVTAKWGDNLLNGRPLRAGKPIRVEMNLVDADADADLVADTGTGFLVEKLTLDALDRDATYGTRGVPAALGYSAWTSGAEVTVKDHATGAALFTELFPAEINSTGKVVYGFNWGTAGGVSPAVPGTYDIVFTIPDTSGVTITGAATADEGEEGTGSEVSSTPKTATVTVVVGTGGGGGGKPAR